MTEFKEYSRKGLSEMTPFVRGMDLTGVSISDADKVNGSPTKGDMIARNPKNHNDLWLVAEKYFNDNLELAKTTEGTFKERLLIEAQELATKTNGLNDFMRTKAFVRLDRENKDLLYTQSRLMNKYLQVLGKRLELLDVEFEFKN